MPNDIPTHIDHREALVTLLDEYTAPEPLDYDISTYEAWKPAKRRAFDERRLERIVSSIVVPIPPLEELLKEVRRASFFAERPVGRRGVFLSGPAAAGKTTAAFHAMVEAHRRHVNRYPDWKELGHTPVVYIEVASDTTAKGFMGRLLDFFGVPYTVRTTAEERTRMAMHQLTYARTSLIVIDEMQNLARLSAGHFAGSAQAIKNMMNGVRAVPLYVGINLDQSAVTHGELGAQFAGRSSLVRLGHLGYRTRHEQDLWRGVIHSFEQQLGLMNHAPKTLFPHAEELWRRTGGSIGELARLLTTGALELVLEGNPRAETLTLDYLSTIKLAIASERSLDAGQPTRKGAINAAA